MNNQAMGPFESPQGPEPVEGLRLRPFRPPLRASLERAESTLSKPATKILNLLRVLIHEC